MTSARSTRWPPRGISGPEQGAAWAASLHGKSMARIAIAPEWVGILDFRDPVPPAP